MSALVPLLVTLPLLGAAIALIFGRNRRLQIAVSVATLTVVLVLAVILLIAVDNGTPIAVSVGGWPIPFGILLYVDTLSALLVAVSCVVLLAVLLLPQPVGSISSSFGTRFTVGMKATLPSMII